MSVQFRPPAPINFRRFSLKKIAILLFFCLLLPWSVSAKELEIELKYMPRDKVNVRPKEVSPLKIYFEAVEDNRSQPRRIGENIEDKNKKVQIVTPDADAASQLIRTVLKNEFKNKGFAIEDSFDRGQKIIQTTLEKFWTLEESRYNSVTQLRVEVREKSGEVSFRRIYSTTGSNSGRSLSEVNYNESYSDALARMVEKLFSDSEFLRVLAEKPRPRRVEEKPIPDKRVEEKKLEELRMEVKRLEEIKAEERRAKEKQLEEKRAEERRLEEIKAEEKRIEEKKAKEKQLDTQRAEEKRLEEIRAEVKRLEEKKAEEKQAEEKRLEDLKAEEQRLEEVRTEVKKLEELKALRESIAAEEKLAEEKKKEEEKKAKEKRAVPAKPKPAGKVFGPK